MPTRHYALAAALLVSSMPSFGAAGPDLTKPPQTAPVPDIQLPSVDRWKLSNGLNVVVSADDRFPLTTLRLAFLGGSKFDPQDLPGLSDTVAALLNQGTKTRTAKQIALEAADYGGQIDAVTGPDALTLNGSCLSQNLDKFTALFADVARNSNFPADEVELQKQNRLQTLRAARAQSEYVARETLAAAMFGSGPYGHIGPTEHALSAIDQKRVADFRDTYLVPNNAYLVIVGRVPETKALRKILEDHFGEWRQKEVPAPPQTTVPANAKRLVFVDRPGSVQADVLAAHATPSYGSDYFPLIIGSRILGGGTNARLFTDIREKHGFAYDAHTESEMKKGAGTVMAVTEVRNEVIAPALEALNADLRAISDADVQSVELSEAKASFAGRFILGLERQSERAAELTRMQIMNLPADFLDTYMTHVRSVEPNDIRKTGKYWTPEDATVVVVGDAAKIQKDVAKFGKVEVFKPAE